MPEYEYTPLNVHTGEIRLVELHPGAFDDPIKISISTAPLVIPKTKPREEDRLEKIRNNLPGGWYAYETLEGRIVFWHEDEEGPTWDHPNPDHDRALCEADEAAIGVAQLAFEALSYTWGPDGNQTAIEVLPLAWECSLDSEAAIVSLAVRQNLHDALKHLRNPAAPRTLWIDAISINQKDLAERSLQVNRMGDIFKHARRVVVWLGLASHDSSIALRVLGRIGDQIEWSKGTHVLPAPDCTEMEWYKTTDASCIDDDPETWRAVYDLICRPWFRRLWVRLPVCRLHVRQTLTWYVKS